MVTDTGYIILRTIPLKSVEGGGEDISVHPCTKIEIIFIPVPKSVFFPPCPVPCFFFILTPMHRILTPCTVFFPDFTPCTVFCLNSTSCTFCPILPPITFFTPLYHFMPDCTLLYHFCKTTALYFSQDAPVPNSGFFYPLYLNQDLLPPCSIFCNRPPLPFCLILPPVLFLSIFTLLYRVFPRFPPQCIIFSWFYPLYLVPILPPSTVFCTFIPSCTDCLPDFTTPCTIFPDFTPCNVFFQFYPPVPLFQIGQFLPPPPFLLE